MGSRPGLRSGRPIIGIAQSGSDLNPCNRIHLELAKRTREGIRDAGGICIEFPTHPIFENCRRPTAAMDRSLAYLGLVEILHGYPIDAVVLTTGCDKTTPAASWPPAPWTSRPSCSRVAPCSMAGTKGSWWAPAPSSGRPPQARRRRDQRRTVLRHGLRLGAFSRPLQHHGHGLHDERRSPRRSGSRCPAVPPSRRPTANAPRWPTRPAAASSRWPTRT